jgi:cytoskeleton protein RodZ
MIFCKSKEIGALPGDMTNFGASFKKARESRGVSLDQIAAETRISTRFLLAIENEEFNLLPGGIFNRGFVRSYAEKVGLDPDQAVADYERLAQVREPLETTPVAAPAPQETKSGRKLYPVAIGGLLLLIIIFYVVTRESSNTAQTASTPSPAVSVPPPAGVPPSQPAQPPPAPPQITAAAPEPEPAPAPAPASEPLRIDLDVKEQTWIRVEADGNPINPGELLEPGMTRHFGAQKSIFLTIGNASGLVLKVNDMPARNLGKNGQVRELHITPNNIKDFTG